MKRNAIGVVEVNYFANSVIVVDAMMKAAEVELVSCHKTLGGRMVHTIVAGETSAVNATIEAANAAESIIGKDNLKVAVTISNPHPEIMKLLNLINAKVK
ncbi:MAG: microcompartment protein [Herbinix sp.]|nr:microcompartment protein [Herbinix sp.]